MTETPYRVRESFINYGEVLKHKPIYHLEKLKTGLFGGLKWVPVKKYVDYGSGSFGIELKFEDKDKALECLQNYTTPLPEDKIVGVGVIRKPFAQR